MRLVEPRISLGSAFWPISPAKPARFKDCNLSIEPCNQVREYSKFVAKQSQQKFKPEVPRAAGYNDDQQKQPRKSSNAEVVGGRDGSLSIPIRIVLGSFVV